MVADSDYVAIERRLEFFLVGTGMAMTLGAALGWGYRAAIGATAGTLVCWLNFRWLRQGAAAIVQLGLVQAGAEKIRVPKSVHVKFVGRLGLLLLAAYAILIWLRLPAIAVVCGLTAVLPAIVFEVAYEVIHRRHRWNTQ